MYYSRNTYTQYWFIRNNGKFPLQRLKNTNFPPFLKIVQITECIEHDSMTNTVSNDFFSLKYGTAREAMQGKNWKKGPSSKMFMKMFK